MEYTRQIIFAFLFTIALEACSSMQKIESVSTIQELTVGKHSAAVFIVMYDKEVGKEAILKGIKRSKATIVYDYKNINAMAIKKPNDTTLKESMTYFQGIKGVLSVEYDHILPLIMPIEPKQEIQ